MADLKALCCDPDCDLEAIAEAIRPEVESKLKEQAADGDPAVSGFGGWASIIGIVMTVLQALKDSGVLGAK